MNKAEVEALKKDDLAKLVVEAQLAKNVTTARKLPKDELVTLYWEHLGVQTRKPIKRERAEPVKETEDPAKVEEQKRANKLTPAQLAKLFGPPRPKKDNRWLGRIRAERRLRNKRRNKQRLARARSRVKAVS